MKDRDGGCAEGSRIAVLLASYNGAPYIGQQIDSILDQTVSDIRIIISDDGSTDGTAEILSRYQAAYPDRITVMNRPEDRPRKSSEADRLVPAPARNFFRLLSQADADYIFLSDQDDIWIPEKAERMLKRMRRIERKGVPALVFSDMEVTDETLNRISPSFFAYSHCRPDRTGLAELLVENPVTGGALVMNRALLELVRQEPEACFMHDWWIALCAAAFGRISCVREALSLYRQHGNNALGARASGSFSDMAERPARQREVEENYRRMFAQAAAWKKMYEERLTRAQLALVEDYLALPGQSVKERYRNIRRNHFYKSSRFQTWAQCFTIPRMPRRAYVLLDGNMPELKRARSDGNVPEPERDRLNGNMPKPERTRPSGNVPEPERTRLDESMPERARSDGNMPEPKSPLPGCRIVCVILNYNDAETTERLTAQIHDYPSLSHILLVDNASADDSYERLKRLEDSRVSVIRAGTNGGYGAGNNLGVRYAAEHLGATHVLIANPDIMVTDRCIRKLARIFRHSPEIGIAAAVMTTGGDVRRAAETGNAGTGGRAFREPDGQKPPCVPQNAWRLHGFFGELLFMGPISRRLFWNRLYYPASYFKNKKAVYVDAVHGSMLMADVRAFLDCGGYDEGIFLYQEEMVLGRRMKAAGYRTVLLTNETYAHLESASISKSVRDELKRQNLRERSVLYYMKHYLGIGPLRTLAAKMWFGMIRMEVRLFRLVFKS